MNSPSSISERHVVDRDDVSGEDLRDVWSSISAMGAGYGYHIFLTTGIDHPWEAA